MNLCTAYFISKALQELHCLKAMLAAWAVCQRANLLTLANQAMKLRR